MTYTVKGGRLERKHPEKPKIPLAVGRTVILRKIPNHSCDALRPEHVNKLKGVIVFAPKPDDADECDRPLWTVAFPIGHVYVTEDLVEVIA